MSDEHKPLTAAEKIIQQGLAASPRHDFPQEFGEMMSALTSCNLHDKGDIAQAMAYMLSLLTPPTDAELREAVEYLTNADHTYYTDDPVPTAWRVETLLRAVQAPRLPLDGPQTFSLRDVLTGLADAVDHLLSHHNCDCQGYEILMQRRDAARRFAAFRSVFGKEG